MLIGISKSSLLHDIPTLGKVINLDFPLFPVKIIHGKMAGQKMKSKGNFYARKFFFFFFYKFIVKNRFLKSNNARTIYK